MDFFGELNIGSLHFKEDLSDDDGDNGKTGFPSSPLSNQTNTSKSVLGLSTPSDILTVPSNELKSQVHSLLRHLGVPPSPYPGQQPQRGIYCSRTTNIRSIQALGYDLDYSLVHYSVEAWEGRAYYYMMQELSKSGVPVEGLKFDQSLVIRGLIMDTELGNIVKTDRFGNVKRAMHGTRMLTPSEVRRAYGRQLISLRDNRYVFLVGSVFCTRFLALY